MPESRKYVLNYYIGYDDETLMMDKQLGNKCYFWFYVNKDADAYVLNYLP